MKRFLKAAVFAALALTLGICAFAEEAAIPDESLSQVSAVHDDEISIVCIGNSILAHGVAESIGWYNNWGMAASDIELDYYHLLQKKVKEAGFTNVTWSRAGISSLERAIDKRMDYDYASEINANFASVIKSAKPDVVILQMGENVSGGPTVESYAHALECIADFIKSVNPDVQIIFSKPFWGGDAKCLGVELAAEHTGFPYGDISVLNANEYKAIGLFEHSGVASHPGDKGMAAIADIYFEQLDVILKKKFVDPDLITVKVDGQYIDFDVPPMLVNDRTMIPVRYVSETLGAEVTWNNDTETAAVYLDGNEITVTIGANFITKNGEKIEIDVPAMLYNDRTLVPLRAVAEALDCKVDWVDETQTVLITKEKGEIVYPKEIKNDTCDALGKSGFYGGSAELAVKQSGEERGNYINVNCVSAGKVWNYIWAKMDLAPGATYVLSADVRVLKDSRGTEVPEASIGMCMHYDGKDHGVGTTKAKAGEWTHIEKEYTIPASTVKIPGDDKFGIYADPVNDYGISFDVDNVSVVLKEGAAVETFKPESAGGFTALNGFMLVAEDNTVGDRSTVHVTAVDGGVKVTHGGYYQTGANCGGVVSDKTYSLDDFSAKIKFEKLPEVTEQTDCWIAVDFVAAGRAFFTNNFDLAKGGNQGIMDLIRFGRSTLEVYNGVNGFGGVWNSAESTDEEKKNFAVKAGSTLTVSVKALPEGMYRLTLQLDDNKPFEVPYDFPMKDVFKDGKAFFLVSASAKGSKDGDFVYTVTDIKG